jgi:hypothetical protein
MTNNFLGGMPTPARPIPIRVVESDWFKEVDGEEGLAYLPASVQGGSSVTLDGSIKVRIRNMELGDMPPSGKQFLVTQEMVYIYATMPWIDRQIPNFNGGRPVDIQFPCEFRNFSYLSAIPQGGVSPISFEVRILLVLVFGSRSRYSIGVISPLGLSEPLID